MVHALLDELTQGYSDEQLDEIARDGAQAVMKSSLRGLYNAVFALLASPQRYSTHANTLWCMHYDSGRLEVEETAPREHTSKIRDWHSHHPLVCRLNTAAVAPIYEAMGCREVVTQRLECVAEGGTACVSRVRWT